MIFSFLSQVANNQNIQNFPIPKTWPEVFGVSIILLLSGGAVNTFIQAWMNRNTIKDNKRDELQKLVEAKDKELNKALMRIGILEVKLENANFHIETLQKENEELQKNCTTGFNQREELLREQINRLIAENQELKRNQ